MAYEKGWRSNKQSGEISWSDNWVDGSNFQQLKGQGAVNKDFDAEFAGLSKSDSDVDDDGAWVTLKQQAGQGATADAKALASKWQAAGYDVRIQDLEGAEGTTQADIAVRKGSGQAAAPKKEEKIEMSPEYAHAKARVQQYTDDVTSGRTGKELFGEAPDSTSFMDRYKLHLGERLENGNYRPKKYATGDSSILDKNSSMLTSDEAAIAELNREEKDPREDY